MKPMFCRLPFYIPFSYYTFSCFHCFSPLCHTVSHICSIKNRGSLVLPMKHQPKIQLCSHAVTFVASGGIALSAPQPISPLRACTFLLIWAHIISQLCFLLLMQTCYKQWIFFTFFSIKLGPMFPMQCDQDSSHTTVFQQLQRRENTSTQSHARLPLLSNQNAVRNCQVLNV